MHLLVEHFYFKRFGFSRFLHLKPLKIISPNHIKLNILSGYLFLLGVSKFTI